MHQKTKLTKLSSRKAAPVYGGTFFFCGRLTSAVLERLHRRKGVRVQNAMALNGGGERVVVGRDVTPRVGMQVQEIVGGLAGERTGTISRVISRVAKTSQTSETLSCCVLWEEGADVQVRPRAHYALLLRRCARLRTRCDGLFGACIRAAEEDGPRREF